MKKIILVVLLLLIGGGVYGLYLFNKKTPNLVDVKPDYSLTAEELYQNFSTDEKSALKKYEGKVLEIEGKVLTFSQTDSISNIVLDGQEAFFGTVNCSLKHLKDSIQTHQKLIVKGRCQGFLNSVILNNCVIVNTL